MRKELENMALHASLPVLKGEDLPTGIRYCAGNFWRVKHRSGKTKICESLLEVETYLDLQYKNFNG